MSQEFEKRIKAIEQELIDLKTASEYSSVRSANFSSGFNVTIGTYRVDYDGDNVMSIIYCANSAGVWGSGLVYGRTPNGSTQIVEVGYSEYILSGSDTETVPMVIISNARVLSLTKLS